MSMSDLAEGAARSVANVATLGASGQVAKQVNKKQGKEDDGTSDDIFSAEVSYSKTSSEIIAVTNVGSNINAGDGGLESLYSSYLYVNKN
jgi:hypothetical protein